jgi:hypothetical protein
VGEVLSSLPRTLAAAAALPSTPSHALPCPHPNCSIPLARVEIDGSKLPHLPPFSLISSRSQRLATVPCPFLNPYGSSSGLQIEVGESRASCRVLLAEDDEEGERRQEGQQQV